jgi:hypothetical protein
MTKKLTIAPPLNPKQKLALKVLFNHKNGVTDVLFGGAA